MNPYLLIVVCSSILILSYFFNVVSDKTRIPSVLMLVVLGMIGKQVIIMNGKDINALGIDFLLEVLGNVGLVMIVLEAALDLKISKENKGVLLRSFGVALLNLVLCAFAIGGLFSYIFPESNYYSALIYAVPLSIMSSAIIIPSVGSLLHEKKEFMIYEATFSDILGIMLFYFLLGEDSTVLGTSFGGVVLNILSTVVVALVAAYGMVYLMKFLKQKTKLFVIISILLLLFSMGKMMHLSSLLIILTFGLVINNTSFFLFPRIQKFFDLSNIPSINQELHMLTNESSFLVRSFFFVLFGMSISLASLYDWRIAVNGIVITLIIYLVRFLSLRLLSKENIFPELFIAPRGLITILLFFVILKDDRVNIQGFDPGLLVYPIIISSLIMTYGLMRKKGAGEDRVWKSKWSLFKTKKVDA